MRDLNRKVLSGLWIGLASAVIFALWSSPLAAQGTYGSIVGTVTDPSGGVIPGATVTVTNIGTNEKHTATTDAAGNYRFVNLPPANYRMAVEAAGFKRLTREPIIVQVNSAVRSDAKLEVGAINETIEVTSTAPLLQTETATLSQVVEGQQVEAMPLNGRNVINLIALTAGVVPQGSAMGAASLNQMDHTNNMGFGNFQIGGGISNTNAMYIDGAPINVLVTNNVGLVITQDSVQEFNVSTNSASSEYGRTGGGVVNMATKSGSNAFHGSVYEYFRNTVLNANKWETNRVGMSRSIQKQNQYGATLGGPIVKDKAFFFFSWEGFHSRLGVSALSYMPTEDMFNGVVPDTYRGQPVTIKDPTGRCQGIAHNTTAGTWTIPKSCYDPAATWYLNNYYNHPNTTAFPGQNFYLNPIVGDDYNQYTARADYNISAKQRLFGRYTYWDMTGRNQDRADRPLSADSASDNLVHQVVLGDTYTFTPTTMLDVRLFYFRAFFNDRPSSLGYDISQISSGLKPYMDKMTYNLVPGIGFQNTTVSLFGGQRGGLNLNTTNSYGFAASLSKMKGSHNLKIGNEFRLMDRNYGGGKNVSGSWSFNANTPMTGYFWSDFLLGIPTSVSLGSALPSSNFNYYQGYYVTDTWQVNRRLTLNLGLRWELPGAIAEKDDRLTVLLPDKLDPVTNAVGTLALVKSDLYPDRTSAEVKHNLFAPRVGLAFRITNSTVLRAGYGLSHLPPETVGGLGGESSVINAASRTWDNTRPYAGYVLATLANPFPAEPAPPSGGTAYPGGVPPSAGRDNPNFMKNYYNPAQPQAISGAYPYQPYPYIQQWNLALGHQFAWDTMVDLSYAGSRGTHLPTNSININQLPHYSNACANSFVGATSDCWASANAYVAAGHTAAQTASYFQQYRPYPYFGNVTQSSNYAGNSFYHSMQVKVQKRIKSGGLLMANYTWAKYIANVDSQNSALDAKPGAGATAGIPGQAYQDNTNLRGEQSLSAYDVRQRLLINYVWQLPFGQGKRFASDHEGVVGKLISGWDINGIMTFQDGFPLNLRSNSALGSVGGGTGRPNVVSGCNPSISGSAQSRLDQWFNTACFQQLASTYFGVGNEPRVNPKLTKHGINNWDFSVLKTTTIKENVKVQFRAEFFNLFNRVQFSPPDADSSSATFGRTYVQMNQPRTIQFSLRLNF